MVDINDEYIWIVVVGFILAFILCLGIGANDVANAFGTSVGSKVLTLRQACILATIFETAGAILLGAKVSETVRKGIIDVSLYENSTEEFLLGNLAALGGSAIWLTIATALRVPVSTTHSIVGATVGFALVVNGSKGIDWFGLGKIVLSWFISPVLSGIITVLVFLLCDYAIIKKPNALEKGLAWLPVFYAATITLNIFSIFYDGPERFYFDRIPLWGIFILSFGAGTISATVVRVYIVPRLRRTIIDECTEFHQTEKSKILHGTPGNPTTFTTSTSTDALVASRNHSNVTLKSYTNEGFTGDETLAAPSMVDLGSQGSDGTTTPPNGRNANFTIGPPKGSPNSKRASTATTLTEGTETPPSARSEKSAIGEGPAMLSLSTDLPEKEAAPYSNGAANGQVTPVITVSGVVDGEKSSVPNDYENLTVPNKEGEEDTEKDTEVKDSPETARLFSFLQILTAVFGSFAHGGNDVSNGIGPLISIWLVSISNDVETADLTPLWILLYGGIGISVGLWIWGRRVIETLGENLTTVTPSSGFCIELGAAFTVLFASNIGIPVSSTHCKVGSVVSVGRVRSKNNVDWSLFRNIIFSWVVTLPAAGGFSAAIMALLLLSV